MTAMASRTASGKRLQAGFTYVGLVVLVAIIGLVTASAIKLGATVQRARAEQELLRIGAEYSDALQSYADATSAGKPPLPASLQDLLKDARFPTPRRHLRKIYPDPMTGSTKWGIAYLGGGVVAIYSLSDAHPVKTGNFPPRFLGFAGKEHISDWKFTAAGPRPPPPASAAPARTSSNSARAPNP